MQSPKTWKPCPLLKKYVIKHEKIMLNIFVLYMPFNYFCAINCYYSLKANRERRWHIVIRLNLTLTIANTKYYIIYYIIQH